MVGLILVSKTETQTLTGSPHVYFSWGPMVVTSQLASLSLSLGAFAAFYPVATQRDDDRKEFIGRILQRLHQVLLVYAIYCRSVEHSATWTGVPVAAEPLRGRLKLFWSVRNPPVHRRHAA